uniref:Uncharacterized protein n=1 Tax=Aureoumbra lagunensis TaxID=44058 RepID=A0A7S3NLG1_9STRA
MRDDDDHHDYDENEEEEQVESALAVGITNKQTYPDASRALEAEKKNGLDLFALIHMFKLDFYGGVRLINTARRLADEGLNATQIFQRLETDLSWQNDAAALTPIIEDDALIEFLDEIIHEDESDSPDVELQARLDSITQDVAQGSQAVRSALQQDESSTYSELERIAALVPQLLTDDDLIAEKESDSRSMASLKRDIIDARSQLLIIARRAQALLPSSSSSNMMKK